MKRILFLISLLFFLLSVVLIAEAQITPEEVKKVVTTTPDKKDKDSKDSKDKETPVNVDVLDRKQLNELSDSTQTILEDKKKDVSKSVVAGQKALLEKEAIQDKVDNVEKQLEETKTKIKDTEKLHSKTAVHELKQQSKQLEKEYQVLKNELKIKNDKANKELARSSQQQDEIELLKQQLNRLAVEKNKRYSPRKKALIVGVIILLMLIGLFVKDKLFDLLDKWLIYQGAKRHSIRTLRTRTFLRIFGWSISILMIAIGIFLILELFGFNSTHTLAGAGIFGVAIGFGAQQFIKDIFSGIFLVLEGQYKIDDFISVGQHSGNVEDINLRFTKLRNYDGNIVYVPNGDIQSVVNYGKGYANSAINFHIDVKQDIDQVFSLIREVVSELRSAPDLVDDILGDVALLGINAFTPTGIEVKFRVKTAPQSQWQVGREIRLALKQRFDLEGIKLFQYQYENQLAKSS